MITLRREKGTPLTHDELDNNFEELDKIPNGKIFPKDFNSGIKIEIHDKYCWKVMPGRLILDLNDPSIADFNTYKGNIKVTQLEEQKGAFTNFCIPYDIAPNSDLYLKVNWSHNSDVVIGGSVTFSAEFIYAKCCEQMEFTDPLIVSMVGPVNNTKYMQITTSTILTSNDGSQNTFKRDIFEPGGILHCKGILDSNDIQTSDNSIVNPFIHYIGLLYQSRIIGTLNRTPNFYD